MSTNISEQTIEEKLGRPQTLVEKQIHAWGENGEPIIVNLDNSQFFRPVYFIKCDTIRAIRALSVVLQEGYCCTPYEDYDEENYKRLTHEILYYNDNGDWVELTTYFEEARRVLAIAEKIKGE